MCGTVFGRGVVSVRGSVTSTTGSVVGKDVRLFGLAWSTPGQVMRSWRLVAGRSMAALSRELGWSASLLEKYEHDQRSATGARLSAWAGALNAPPVITGQLAALAGPPPPVVGEPDAGTLEYLYQCSAPACLIDPCGDTIVAANSAAARDFRWLTPDHGAAYGETITERLYTHPRARDLSNWAAVACWYTFAFEVRGALADPVRYREIRDLYTAHPRFAAIGGATRADLPEQVELRTRSGGRWELRQSARVFFPAEHHLLVAVPVSVADPIPA